MYNFEPFLDKYTILLPAQIIISGLLNNIVYMEGIYWPLQQG